jgi:CHASE1-domain containing sensor protein
MFLFVPAQESGASRKMVIWTVAGIVILIALLLAALLAVHLAKILTEENKRNAPANASEPR